MRLMGRWVIAVVLVMAMQGIPAGARDPSDVKIYVLAGQSNMEGKGKGSDYDKNGTLLNGTMLYLLKDPRTAAHFAKYWDTSIGSATGQCLTTLKSGSTNTGLNSSRTNMV